MTKFNIDSRIAAAKERLFGLDRESLELKFMKAALTGNLGGTVAEAHAAGIDKAEIDRLVLGTAGSIHRPGPMTAMLPRPAFVRVNERPKIPPYIADQSRVESAKLGGFMPDVVASVDVGELNGGSTLNSVAEEAAHRLSQKGGGRFGHRFVASSVEESPLREDGLVDGLLAWLKSPFVLQTPHRAAHKGIEALGMTLTTYHPDGTELGKAEPEAEVIQVIQVDHDWAALFGASSTEGAGGEWHLPYNIQVFEFAISGAAVIAAINADPVVTSMSIGIRPPGKKSWVTDRCGVRVSGDKWSLITHTDLPAKGEPAVNAAFDRLYDFLLAQVRATSIMLEAEVAVTEPVRAPYKSNQPPKDRKPLPLLSHHIVRLNRRPRAAALPRDDAAEPNRRVRLHFRRGHWRHYSNHKTWIAWMLAGNPDLGFVEKEYRT